MKSNKVRLALLIVVLTSGLTSRASNPTDYFRSATTGNWNVATNWQASSDNSTWSTASSPPTSAAKSIMIQSGHTITITTTTSAANLIIAFGGTLYQSSATSFTISDDGMNAVDFSINGTYVLKGAHPTLLVGASVQINSGGIVRVDATDGQSDAFASNSAVLFKTGSVFQWNTSSLFSTNGITYFQGNGYANEQPIFRITKKVGFLGGGNATIINGKLEATTDTVVTILWRNAGKKIFRDGIGGNGKFTHTSNCGTFEITGTSARIDGTCVITLENNTSSIDMEIASGAQCTISGSPTINVGSDTAAGSDLLLNGTLVHTGSIPIDLSQGNLTISGYIDASSTGTFRAGNAPTSLTDVTVVGSTNDAAGVLAFTLGAQYLHNFTMNRTDRNSVITMGSDVVVANMLTLAFGRIVTGAYKFTAYAGKIAYPISYNDSYIATCTANGGELSGVGLDPETTTAFDGAIGFCIKNLPANGFVMFPVGADVLSANRMEINMNGTSGEDITVVLRKDDIETTPNARVNRLYYTHATINTGLNAQLRLYYTKRDWSSWGISEDEVEEGFIYAYGAVVEKDYSGGNYFIARTDWIEIPDWTSNTLYPYDSEVYGQYLSTLPAIQSLAKFEVVNPEGIILPVSLTNLAAGLYDKNVVVSWKASNQQGIVRYVVEHGKDGINFAPITDGSIQPFPGADASYRFVDTKPFVHATFYRVVAIDKDGNQILSGVVRIGIQTVLTIFPNPLREWLYIDGLQGSAKIYVYDAAGKNVLNASTDKMQIDIPFSALASGMYFVVIHDEKGIKKWKVIK